jgi:transcriptional regulator with XRE-family HTH domain
MTRGESILGPSPPGIAHRAELGAFLRSRRERIAPSDVGLTPSGGRRTPGLRREEVAALAGVGLSWYTWLEQGRSVTPSAPVLDAIAGALRLASAERAHLFHLARAESPLPVATDHDDAALMSLAAFTSALQPHPAYVTGPSLDVLAWNRAAENIVADFGAMAPERRNLLWWLFTDQRFAARRTEPGSTARRTIARFRAAMGRHRADPRFHQLVDELSSASMDFRAIWNDGDVLEEQSGFKEIMRIGLGKLRFHHMQTVPAGHHDLRLTIYAPADVATRSILNKLEAPDGAGIEARPAADPGAAS